MATRDPRDVSPERPAPPHPDPPGARKSWWAGRRRWWELFLQFSAVLLGVLLASAATSWREERALHETRDRALRGLANEVAYNRSFLAARVSYYRSILAGIAAARTEKGAQATVRDVPAMRGFNPPFFRRAAYEVSFHSGAFARFEYGLAERIAATYALQEWMLAGVDKTTDYLIRRLGENLGLDDLRMVFEDWAQMGDELLGYHDTLLGHLPPPDAFDGDLVAAPVPTRAP